MLRHLRTRRRHRYGAYICASIASLLLLLSVSLLHSRLSFFTSNPQHPHPLPHDIFNPLTDDLDSDLLTNSRSSDDRIDEDDAVLDSNTNTQTLTQDDDDDDDDDDFSQNPNPSSSSNTNSNYFFDHVHGVVRRSFNRRSIEEWEDYVPFDSKLRSELGLGLGIESRGVVYGSDDVLVDEKLRGRLSEVKRFEDVLLLKGSVLREGWGEWFDKKGDFLRRDRMFKSNIEVLNPLNNPILQDPDSVGGVGGGVVGGLTRGDRVYLKGVMDEFKKTPFLLSKKKVEVEVRRVERRTLNNEKEYYADGKRWGYYPGLDGGLAFGNFMDEFFRKGKCRMRVFMVWNSPAWMFGVRQQRVLESLLYHNRDACVVVFSETIELNFFSGFVKEG